MAFHLPQNDIVVKIKNPKTDTTSRYDHAGFLPVRFICYSFLILALNLFSSCCDNCATCPQDCEACSATGSSSGVSGVSSQDSTSSSSDNSSASGSSSDTPLSSSGILPGLSSFSSSSSTETPPCFTDSRDGQSYSCTTIGSQIWMAENLNYDTGGDSWCFSTRETFCDSYGRLYTWSGAMAGDLPSDEDPSGVKGACPEGWHLPSTTEWETLANYVASETGLTATSEDGWDEIGPKLKATSMWNNEGTGTDDFDFAAISGGYRDASGRYYYQGYYGWWWSASEEDTNQAYRWGLDYGNDLLYRGAGNKEYAYSIRCVKDGG